MPRRLGSGSGARDSRRQGPRTDLAFGQQRPRRHAVRAVVAPMVRWWVSFQGSNPMRPPVWRDTWRQRTGQGSLSTPSPPRSQRSHSGCPRNRKNPIRSNSSESSAAAPSARGRPRGIMATCGGPQGGERPRASGSIAGPVHAGRGAAGRLRTAGPDGRPLLPPALSPTSPAPAALGPRLYSFRSWPGGREKRGRRKTGMEAQASPVGERASPAPNQSSGFTSA